MASLKSNLCFLSLFALLLIPAISADTGPKPGIDFSLNYAQVQPAPTLIKATLLECRESDCSDARPMMEAGPQRIQCSSQGSCFALSYGFTHYLRLKLEFSDKNRSSNIFESPPFSGSYAVDVLPDGLNVSATGIFSQPPVRPWDVYDNGGANYMPMPNLEDLLAAILITELFELPIAAIVLKLWKKPMKILWLVAALNVLTVPALWIAINPLSFAFAQALYQNQGVGAMLAFLLLELLVAVVEALALWKFSAKFGKTGAKKAAKPAGLTISQSAILSFAINLVSMVGGFFLLVIISIFAG